MLIGMQLIMLNFILIQKIFIKKKKLPKSKRKWMDDWLSNQPLAKEMKEKKILELSKL